VLPRNVVITVPDLLGFRVRSQVFNVPVGTVGRLKMVRQTGANATGAVGAADVNVESWLELQIAKLANADWRSDGR